MPPQTDGILKSGRLGAELLKLCTAKETVSSLVAADPGLAPADAWKALYGAYRAVPDDASQGNSEQDDLRRAAQCGQWGPTKPSELFLQIYRDVLATVEESPDRAMVSPPLLGSCGVVPLTVISTIPDIARHMANVIARAEKEVFLATNYWQDSVASRYLTNALYELDRRAADRGVRVVVKVIYDRGSLRQLTDPHAIASVGEYAGKNVALPSPEAVPNIDMQVMNYHQPIMGTFHAKFMVVDRKIALLQSNNIQDNTNLEMMVQFEGPIVDSFYDMALLSWSKKLEPPLPSLDTPAAVGGISAFTAKKKAHTHMPWHKPGAVDSSTSSKQAAGNVHRADAVTGPTTTASTLHPHASKVAEGSNGADTVTDHTAEEEGTTSKDTSKPASKDNTGSVAADDVPANNDTTEERVQAATEPNIPNGPDPETKAFLDRGKQALPRSHIHKPTSSDVHLPQSTAENPQYDDDIAGEVTRVQSSLVPRPGETPMQPISRLLNHTVNDLKADAPAFGHGDEMTPYVAHPAHEPFPMAMVNRPPFGKPLHSSVVQPQNAAWLSALRNARKNVFIQTPTLNAEPLLPAIREACERGIDVICYISLGYNDTGELLPRQGGTNDMVAHQLYAALSAEARKHLHYFWYVGKDQTRPIPQVKKQRDSHVKLMIVDETIGIMGNGNQDTQSWYHSQEINVMLENADVCRAWIDAVRRNQNTHIYGMLDKETGLWRDFEGKEADGAIGPDPGRFSWARGVIGAVQRVQGKGGF